MIVGTVRAQLFGLSLLVVLPSLAGCSEEEVASERIVLATLGDRSIDFDRFLVAARARSVPGEFPRSGSGFEAFRDRVLKDLVVEEVLLGEASVRAILLESEEVDFALAEAGEGMEDPDQLPGHLEERYGSVDAYRQVLRRRLLAERVEESLREELLRGVVATPEQVDANLGRYADELRIPARIRARQIFAEDAETAHRLRVELLSGVDFQTVARAHNGNDGDMGWMDEDAAPQLLLESSASLPRGGMSEVLRSPLGYHIFQVVDRRPASTRPKEEARKEVERRMRGEAVESRLKAWLANRTDRLKLTVDAAAVDDLRCCRLGLPYVVGSASGEGASP